MVRVQGSLECGALPNYLHPTSNYQGSQVVSTCNMQANLGVRFEVKIGYARVFRITVILLYNTRSRAYAGRGALLAVWPGLGIGQGVGGTYR